jgi:pyruvate dehydrogenase E2 component (dihydrolipoamide acetyltransferase)
MGEFRMPSLGADMEQGTVVEWRVQPGDRVHRGDIVAVVETEKAAIEVEIFEDGVVDELLVAVGDEVPVGSVLARVSTEGATVVDPALPGRPAPAPAAEATLAPAVPVGASLGDEGTGRVDGAAATVHSPLVRHLADRLGLDLHAVRGTGPDGSITRADVERAATERERAGPARSAAPAPAAEIPAGGDAVAHAPTEGRARIRATPLARRRAAAQGLDLATIPGATAGRALSARDVADATNAAGRRSLATTPTPMTADQGPRPRSRRAGELLQRSKREIPHYYLSATLDITDVERWLEQHNAARSVHERLLPGAVLLWATAHAAQRCPTMNGAWVDGAFVPAADVHLGVAVHLRAGGLVVPTIADASSLDPDDLMERLRQVVARARAGTLRSADLRPSTITVTNLSDSVVDQVFGVIYPPQVALVGFGGIQAQPRVIGGEVAARTVVAVTLSADHRASDGHEGARFLEAVDATLQQVTAR